jgi:Y_Y_Y domain/Two component regulator propeller
LAQWRGYKEWETYSTASGLASDIVYEIRPQADGVVWVGTEGGLFRGKRNRSHIQWNPVAGLSGLPVYSLRTDPSGDLWIGTETHGVARLRPRTGSVKWFGELDGLVGKAAYPLRFDHQGRLWVATEAGLFVAPTPYEKFSHITEVPFTRIWAIAEGVDGTLWVGGAGGLFAYTSGHWENFTTADGLANQEVLAVGTRLDGTMCIGYRFGGEIDRGHLRSDRLIVEKKVQRPGTDGLVYFLESDAFGRMWVETAHGVDMWDGFRWAHYDMTDALALNDCNLNAFAAEPNGTVWIGTSGGLARFKVRPRLTPAVAPKVVFTKLVMGHTDVAGRKNPGVGINENSLVARYSALNISGESGILFRYRLVGANAAWTETPQRELEFAKLAPGSYWLEIEAQDGDGIWSAQGAEFAFRILTPWYWSWWFVSICALTPFPRLKERTPSGKLGVACCLRANCGVGRPKRCRPSDDCCQHQCSAVPQS